ncbi:hypothetical protein ACFQJD_04670 [Haloplanus sp. GCM10025708]|uniref:hypothetical protein n=1 Tax=Haloplanus sp. GCM10025708 TaxID=3252679 RepID=UPI00361CA4CB
MPWSSGSHHEKPIQWVAEASKQSRDSPLSSLSSSPNGVVRSPSSGMPRPSLSVRKSIASRSERPWKMYFSPLVVATSRATCRAVAVRSDEKLVS